MVFQHNLLRNVLFMFKTAIGALAHRFLHLSLIVRKRAYLAVKSGEKCFNGLTVTAFFRYSR